MNLKQFKQHKNLNIVVGPKDYKMHQRLRVFATRNKLQRPVSFQVKQRGNKADIFVNGILYKTMSGSRAYQWILRVIYGSTNYAPSVMQNVRPNAIEYPTHVHHKQSRLDHEMILAKNLAHIADYLKVEASVCHKRYKRYKHIKEWATLLYRKKEAESNAYFLSWSRKISGGAGYKKLLNLTHTK